MTRKKGRGLIEFHIIPYLSQKDSGGLSVENSELKLRLHAMEQQAHLRDGKICP